MKLNNHINTMIWRYYIYKFFMSLHFFSAVLVPFYLQWGGLTQFQVQLVQSWFMLWIFILEVPTGAIADYFGRKYSIALGAIVVAIAVLTYGSFPHIIIFLLAEFLFALAFALSSGADEALIYDTLKEAGREAESKHILGRAHAINLSGLLIAAPVGSVLASKFGLNAPMIFTAIPFFIAAIVAWFIREPTVHTGSESRRYGDVLKSGIAYLWHHKTLKLLTLDMVVVAAAAYFIIWFYQPLLQQVGISIKYFGMIHAAFVGAQILVASNFSKLEKITGSPHTYLAISALIPAIMFFAVAIFPSPIMVIMFVILAGAFGLSRPQLMSIHMQQFVPSDKRATVLSAVSMTRRFAHFLLNPIIGYMATISMPKTLMILALFPLAIFLFSPTKKLTLAQAAKEQLHE